MKFYTKQLCEQTQVWSFLMNFTNRDEDEESIKENKEWYHEQGRDYEAEQKQNYEKSYKETEPFLLKYLPVSLRSAIYGEFLIYGKIPNQNLMVEIEKYSKILNDLIFNDSDTNIGKAYSRHYKKIQKFLPKDIQGLNEEYSFHDSQILSFEQTSKDEIIIKLKCEGSYLPSDGVAILTFSNVKLAEIGDDYIGNWWLWDETHLSNIGNFDFQALFHSYNSNGEHSLNDLRVVANQVSLSFLDIKG